MERADADVGVLFAEAQLDPEFPSTTAAYPAAAAYVANVIAALEAGAGDGLLPDRMSLININFPVPVEDRAGAKLTKLGDASDLSLPFFDVTQGFLLPGAAGGPEL